MHGLVSWRLTTRGNRILNITILSKLQPPTSMAHKKSGDPTFVAAVALPDLKLCTPNNLDLRV